jgi:hypothetical protein
VEPPPPALLLEASAPEAPWCTALDNLELGILLLAQPWVAGAGVRRADLDRQLARLDLPFGAVYFQRVKRAVARLEEIGILHGSGEGRARSFAATPEGFAALLLNLCALRADPALDGGEFELKRSLVAMLNLLFERLADLPEEETPAPPEIERFFDEVERVAVSGRRVITEEVERQALDVLRLIAEQRRQVERRLSAARERLAHAGGEGTDIDLSRLAENGFGEVSARLAETPEALAALRRLARGAFPRLRFAAAVLRYERYLDYLDGLASLYAAELTTVGLRAYLAARREG